MPEAMATTGKILVRDGSRRDCSCKESDLSNGALFNDLLVAALDRTIPREQGGDIAILIT